MVIPSLDVHSEQKSSSLKLSKHQTGSDIIYRCHHNSSHSYLPYFCAFMTFLCLPFITIIRAPFISTTNTNTSA